MIALIQRVSGANVSVNGEGIAEIGVGLLVLAAVERGDGPEQVAKLAARLSAYRVFPDDAGKMNRSVLDTQGSVLVVSQFTLSGDARHGRRPSFANAAPPEIARALYEDVVRELTAAGLVVETGEFQAMMQVALVNDGPVTILLDSRKTF